MGYRPFWRGGGLLTVAVLLLWLMPDVAQACTAQYAPPTDAPDLGDKGCSGATAAAGAAVTWGAAVLGAVAAAALGGRTEVGRIDELLDALPYLGPAAVDALPAAGRRSTSRYPRATVANASAHADPASGTTARAHGASPASEPARPAGLPSQGFQGAVASSTVPPGVELSGLPGSAGQVTWWAATLTDAGRDRIAHRLQHYWPRAQRVEGLAVEVAVEVLWSRGHDVVYVGRPGRIRLAPTSVSKGPDIVSVGPDGRTVIVDAKGSLESLTLDDRKLRSEVRLVGRQQLSRQWLTANAASRYLKGLSRSGDVGVAAAVARLADIVDGGAPYDAVIVGASPNTSIGELRLTIGAILKNSGGVVDVITTNATMS